MHVAITAVVVISVIVLIGVIVGVVFIICFCCRKEVDDSEDEEWIAPGHEDIVMSPVTLIPHVTPISSAQPE